MDICTRIFTKYSEIVKNSNRHKFDKLLENSKNNTQLSPGLTVGRVSSLLREVNDQNQIYQREFIDKVRHHEALVQKLKSLTGNEVDIKVWAYKQYDALYNVPHVLDVKVEKRTIYIFTDTIYISHSNDTYNMGKFRIEIYTNGGGVKIFSVDRGSISGLIHPHIRASGNCCLGNISNGVSKLVSENEYVVLAQLMIQYLQSYNSSNPYLNIEAWRSYKTSGLWG